MRNQTLGPSFWIAGALFLWMAVPVFAQQVHAIRPSGILELDNGEKVILAGILVPEESMGSLAVLLSKKEISLDEEKSAGNDPAAASVKTVYLYVNNQELNFPFKAGASPRTKKVMVNELLLTLGLARVDKEKTFRRKQDFLLLEAKAARQGMGIWSYELPAAAKK